MKVPVDHVVADEVFALQRVTERFDSLNQGSSAFVVPTEGFVAAVSIPTDGERRDEVLGPTDWVQWIGQPKAA